MFKIIPNTVNIQNVFVNDVVIALAIAGTCASVSDVLAIIWVSTPVAAILTLTLSVSIRSSGYFSS